MFIHSRDLMHLVKPIHNLNLSVEEVSKKERKGLPNLIEILGKPHINPCFKIPKDFRISYLDLNSLVRLSHTCKAIFDLIRNEPCLRDEHFRQTLMGIKRHFPQTFPAMERKLTQIPFSKFSEPVMYDSRPGVVRSGFDWEEIAAIQMIARVMGLKQAIDAVHFQQLKVNHFETGNIGLTMAITERIIDQFSPDAPFTFDQWLQKFINVVQQNNLHFFWENNNSISFKPEIIKILESIYFYTLSSRGELSFIQNVIVNPKHDCFLSLNATSALLEHVVSTSHVLKVNKIVHEIKILVSRQSLDENQRQTAKVFLLELDTRLLIEAYLRCGKSIDAINHILKWKTVVINDSWKNYIKQSLFLIAYLIKKNLGTKHFLTLKFETCFSKLLFCEKISLKKELIIDTLKFLSCDEKNIPRLEMFIEKIADLGASSQEIVISREIIESLILSDQFDLAERWIEGVSDFRKRNSLILLMENKAKLEYRRSLLRLIIESCKRICKNNPENIEKWINKTKQLCVLDKDENLKDLNTIRWQIIASLIFVGVKINSEERKKNYFTLLDSVVFPLLSKETEVKASWELLKLYNKKSLNLLFKEYLSEEDTIFNLLYKTRNQTLSN